MPEIAIGKEFPLKVIPLIKNARKTIDIIVYDWRWYPNQVGLNVQKLNNTIILKAKEKIKIRVLINNDKIINILKENGIETKKLNSGKTLHTKLMIIDGKYTIIGSHNYTQNAFNLNHEASIINDDPETAKKFTEYFNNLFIS